METNYSRQSYLDWLRIMAIVGVLFFHSAMPFVPEEVWHIKNKETSNLLLEFNFWLSRFRMPLLFFISGTVTFFMMKNRTGSDFVLLRLRRLFIPLLFSILVIVPPQVYLERLTQGFQGNFLDFYPSIFNFEPYPKGNFSWHHLWFIAYLFVYDILFAPLFVWLKQEPGKIFLQKVSALAMGKRIYALMLPGVILFTSMVLKYDQTNDLFHDYCFFLYWLCFLLAGYFCIASPALMDSLERNRQFSLTLAFLAILLLNYFRWNDIEPFNLLPDYRNDWRTYVYLAIFPLNAWLWVFAAIGYGKRYLNKFHPAINYINQAVYPFYILHQTVIVIIVYYVVQTSDTILMKYLFTVSVSFAVSMLLYHLLIKEFALTRFLFGMKPKKASKDLLARIDKNETTATEQLTPSIYSV
ncbi:acyltransferase family protein [Adhaeribacter radiodurans]|uniref:Acyltransferase family protein n=1 Tax=Adhaeribacter radiodurans TaxID=2745197 RepID=A0A7L7LDF2_9BACT|nr:acyltransferase family protein [Adhaeribacter radiodurans]QMU30876.1 acyltransferase family protein [Adhaeribacter radiodurans]